jgi:hypothetical protein
MKIVAVPPAHLPDLIPQLLPLLHRAAERTGGRTDAAEIIRAVLNGTFVLWVALDAAGVLEGHFVTEVRQYPKCKMFVVHHCAMRPGSMEAFDAAMHPLVEEVARSAGCAGIEFMGRRGWRAHARKHGFTSEMTVFQKML